MIKRISGVGLVELMVALVLGAIVIQGTIQLYLGLKQQFQYQQAIARLQQSIRATSAILGQSLRSDGSMGCVNLRYLPTLTQARFDSQPSAPSKRGDVVWVKHLKPIYPLKYPITIGQQAVWTQNKIELKQNALVMISDCKDAELFELAEDSKYSKKMGTHLPFKTLITKQYGQAAQFGLFESYIFYVDNTSRKNARGENVTALYRKGWGKHTEELVEGIAELNTHPIYLDNRLVGQAITITAQDVEISSLKRTWIEKVWYR
jgi:hypothetical protein